ncbi:MAG: tetratricopeptide repeat protein [Verrucomicrobia bacterium]|nr:tetratricopeptide repeat protein [Verrucomicrobiota bacterium]
MNPLRNFVEERHQRCGQGLAGFGLVILVLALTGFAAASIGAVESQPGPLAYVPGDAVIEEHAVSGIAGEESWTPVPLAPPADETSRRQAESTTLEHSREVRRIEGKPVEAHVAQPPQHAQAKQTEPEKISDVALPVQNGTATASNLRHRNSAAHDSSSTNSTEVEELNSALREAPPLSANSSLVDTAAAAAREGRLRQWQFTIDMARRFRKENDFEQARKCLESVVDSVAPEELRRVAFLELAFVAQQSKQYLEAQKIFSKYIQKYPDDPGVPELILRQGLLYRDMGVYDMALSKFFAVLSAALKIKNDRLDYYQSLVLLAQRQIADTYYLQGNYDEAAKKYGALLAQDTPNLRRDEIHAKLIYCQSAAGRAPEAAAQAEQFLERFPDSEEVPEMRFHLASAYKKMNRQHAALEQVLALLKSQKPMAGKNPENWRTWQQRTGNQIASQLFTDGNYVDALTVYQTLAQIEASPRWQFPVLYQVGLIFERLQLPEKASEIYAGIIAREKELTGANDTPGLRATFEMAKWRRNFIDWESKAESANLKIRPGKFPPIANASSP